MGYDMHVCKPSEQTANELAQKQQERQGQLAIFYKAHPLGSLLADVKTKQQRLRKELKEKQAESSSPPELEKLRAIEMSALKEVARIEKEIRPDLQRSLRGIDQEIDKLESQTYFRLNIWGMSHYCMVMEKLEMLVYPSHTQSGGFSPRPEGFPGWKSAKDFGLTDEELDDFQEQYYDNPDDCGDQRYLDFIKSHNETMRWCFSNDGLNAHKFDSNDGWIVTPEEITSALAMLENKILDNPNIVFETLSQASNNPNPTKAELQNEIDYWDAWIVFLNAAVKSDGFSVY